ncbi:MAG: aminotransferase class V-fold PLP-dependent enzyme [Acidobacteriota bacterium]|jgi:glutamate/tyrosine decarboxylase-like PLP-dependent enzyme
MDTIVTAALRRGQQYLDRVPELPVSTDPEAEEIRRHLRATYTFDEPMAAEELVDDVAGMLESWAVQTVHPRYFGYFNPTPVPEAVAGDLLAAIYNPQLAVWTHGPAAVEMEQHVLRWLAARFGLPDTAGASFTTGGSEANLTATIVALTAGLPGYADEGIATGARPTLYVSAVAHDSFTKICHMTGVGRGALRVVPVDDGMRLDVAALRARLAADRAEGCTPVMIVATAGTTAAGIIDPLEEVAAVCREHDAWFHVDAAWGGAAALSDELRPLLRGIERADSITCDAHKWLNVTMGAGMFFCRDDAALHAAFRVDTDYMPDLTSGVVDSFITSVQWSRRFIGLKLFMALARHGARGYAEMIEHQAAVGDYLRDQLTANGWRHVTSSPLPLCCVTHPRIESGTIDIDAVLRAVLEDGTAWISKVRLGARAALRACITSYRTERDDIDALVAAMNAAVEI